ncbi:MAG: CoF synthetase [Cohnella sp.]|uniref:AMP-binding protein n=1 Tax=Cohnella sp. TaxID=1883426 RepID=UPI000E36CCCF|nr:AMP-binding protein [Cohnella sp.]REK67530.1 MAG: CoF synthetase [Cohnella sp.]
MLNSGQLQRKLERTLLAFPWYGRLLGHTRAATALSELPLLTAETLERFYYAPGNPLERQPNLHAYRTSGTSSGYRKTIYYSDEDERRYAEIKSDLFARFLRAGEEVGLGSLRTAMSDMGTGHAADTAADVFARIGLQAESVSFRLPVERHLERLEAVRPHVLYTMPSILDRLLAAAERPSRLGIRKVILVGEPAPPAWLEQAALRLGIRTEDIMDTYGSIEIGTIAYFSHAHGRYLFAEGIEAEGWRPSAEPDFRGSAGLESLSGAGDGLEEDECVLVLTSLARDMFPALRYVTYDVVRDFRPIRVNGSWRPSFRALVKRLGPELKHGEKISVYDIEDVVYRHAEPSAAVRVHVADNKLRVRIVGGIGDLRRLAAIERELANRIPEIGAMIRGGLLEALKVEYVPQDDGTAAWADGGIKRKKIYYD